VAAYNRLIPVYAPVTGNAFLYAIHNLHMQTNHAILAGRFDYSRRSALETAGSIPDEYLDLEGPMGNYIQNIYSLPLQVDVRFGKWDDILAAPRPADRHIFLQVIYHFSRGMAFAGKNDAVKARAELEQMKTWMKDSTLRLPFTPFSAAIESADVGRHILAGRIALVEKKYDDAVHSFGEAVRVEENMVYNEPRDWILNPGQYLGHALFTAGRMNEARKAFEADLARNNENPWSLFGLWQVYTAENNSGEALAAMTRFNKARKVADIEFTSAVY
jgi:tetratricopeptide (TPR) repeat protein